MNVPDFLQRPWNEKARSNSLTFLVTEGNRGSEKLSHIPKITEQFGGRDGTRAHVCLSTAGAVSPSPESDEEV